MLKFLDQNVFSVVYYFHQSHLNQIHIWRDLNRKHFMDYHFNQLEFREMFNSSMVLHLSA
jgi:hypothetical protein